MTKKRINLRGWAIWLCCVLCPIAGGAPADVGVFTGSGQNLRQITSEEVQLRSIDVAVIPERGPVLFDGSLPGMDRVAYQCVFELVSLSEDTVKIQVGFPVTSQFTRKPYETKEIGAKEWVLRYRFIARDDSTTYHVDFVPGDEEAESDALFTWEMEFAPLEKRELAVHYTLPMSMILTQTALDLKREYSDERPWMATIGGALAQYFIYETATGASWAGDVSRIPNQVYFHALPS